jgi:hypothetical protein
MNFPSSLQSTGKNCFGEKEHFGGNSLTKLPQEILNKFHKFQQ